MTEHEGVPCWRCGHKQDPFVVRLDHGVTVRMFICDECGAVNREDSKRGEE